MKLQEQTARFADEIEENQTLQIEALRWIAHHPNAHPDERAAKLAVIDELGAENDRLMKRWDEARDEWMRARWSKGSA